jgi:MFS family permease
MPATFPRSSPYSWYVVGTLLVAWIFAYLDRQVLILLIPSLEADLGLTNTQVSLVQGVSFGIFFALAGIPIGWLADRINRRSLAAAGIAIWSVMTIACGLSRSFQELFIARMGVGCGEACLAPASFSIIADYFVPSRRGRAMGIIAIGAPLGIAASSFAGASLLRLLSGHPVALPIVGILQPWQLVLVIIGLPGFGAALLMLTIREPERVERASNLGIQGESLLAYLIQHKRVFLPLYGALACCTVIGNGIVVWGPVVMIRSGEMNVSEIGFLIGMIMLFVLSVAAFAGGTLGDALERWRPLDGRVMTFWIAMPIAAIGLLLFSIHSSIRTTAIAFAVVLTGSTMLNTASYATLHALVPNELRGRVIAVYMLIINIIGYGGGATVIALTTDYLLGNDARLRDAIVIVCLPATVGGVFLSFLARGPYGQLRQKLLGEYPRRGREEAHAYVGKPLERKLP